MQPNTPQNTGTAKDKTSAVIPAFQAMKNLVAFKRTHRQAKKPITPKRPL